MLDGCTATLKVAVTAVVRDTLEAPAPASRLSPSAARCVVVKTTSTQ